MRKGITEEERQLGLLVIIKTHQLERHAKERCDRMRFVLYKGKVGGNLGNLSKLLGYRWTI